MAINHWKSAIAKAIREYNSVGMFLESIQVPFSQTSYQSSKSRPSTRPHLVLIFVLTSSVTFSLPHPTLLSISSYPPPIFALRKRPRSSPIPMFKSYGGSRVRRNNSAFLAWHPSYPPRQTTSIDTLCTTSRSRRTKVQWPR